MGSIGLAENTESKLKDKPDPSLKTILVSQAVFNSVSFLEENMLYPNVRAELIKRGWKPFKYDVTEEKIFLPSCLKRIPPPACNLPMTEESDLSYCFQMVTVCHLFPEIEAVSGKGEVNFIFENKHKDKLLITASNFMFSEKSREENRAAFFIKGWDFVEWNERHEIHDYVNVQLKEK